MRKRGIGSSPLRDLAGRVGERMTEGLLKSLVAVALYVPADVHFAENRATIYSKKCIAGYGVPLGGRVSGKY